MPKPLPPPGAPEARHMYCTSVTPSTKARLLRAATRYLDKRQGTGYQATRTFYLLYGAVIARFEGRPLHGNQPEHDLPEGI